MSEVPAVIKELSGKLVRWEPQPAVYFLCQGNEVVYVGKSVNPWARIKSHSYEFTDAFILPVKTEKQALRLEEKFILELKPRFNSSFKIEGRWYQRARLSRKDADTLGIKGEVGDERWARYADAL